MVVALNEPVFAGINPGATMTSFAPDSSRRNSLYAALIVPESNWNAAESVLDGVSGDGSRAESKASVRFTKPLLPSYSCSPNAA